MTRRWRRPLDSVAQARRIVQEHGARGLAQRIVRRTYHRMEAGVWEFPLRPNEVVSADEVRHGPALEATPARLRIGWVMVPPAPGSGGHTTLFRAIEALESAGHECVILLHDRFAGSLSRQASTIRTSWPRVRAEVRRLEDGVRGLDALVATSWQTAHLVARRAAQVARCFYFVQDYEPWFFPVGSEYVLAEDTYRFGFHGITAGPWLAETLSSRFSMQCDYFEFGADTAVYAFDPATERDGVVFYAKRSVPRRGYALGISALQRFSAARPEARVHLFGDPSGSQASSVIDHGRLTPQQLSSLYNTCRAGLSLSLTNVSLVPWEMAACGAVPVVNDADHNRRVLRANGVVWADLSVAGLSDALIRAWDTYDDRVGASCAASVKNMSWNDALQSVVTAFEDALVAPSSTENQASQ